MTLDRQSVSWLQLVSGIMIFTFSQLVSWLVVVCCLVNLSIGWLVGQLVGWLVVPCCLCHDLLSVGWSVGVALGALEEVGWVGGRVGWLVGWLVSWLVGWCHLELVGGNGGRVEAHGVIP